jgi:hypothetical protein
MPMLRSILLPDLAGAFVVCPPMDIHASCASPME